MHPDIQSVNFLFYTVVKFPDQCSLPKAYGHCYGHIPKWHFDNDLQICKLFVYGGCGGNANQFPSREICETACALRLSDVLHEQTSH